MRIVIPHNIFHRDSLLGSRESKGIERVGRVWGADSKPVETTDTKVRDNDQLLQFQKQLMNGTELF